MAATLSEPRLPPLERIGRYRAPLSLALALAVAALAFAALHQLTHQVHFWQLRRALAALAPWQIGAALTLTAFSYLTLTIYDVLALRLLGRPLPWRTAALASFTSYALSHNLGLSLITGGSARLRVYGAAGVPPADVARIIALASLSFWAGLIVVAAFALLAHQGPLDIPDLSVSVAAQRIAGGLIVAASLTGLILVARRRRAIRLWGWELPLPGPGQALAQVGAAIVDLAAASAALFVLMPQAGLQLYPLFLLGFALACIVSMVSHVPGGLGVFEAVLAAVLPGPAPALLAALIVYRVIYYLIPLAIAAVLLAVHEGHRSKGPIKRTLAGANAVAGAVTPVFMSLLVFLGGVVLLVSGSLPALPQRLHILHRVEPLPFIEVSHFSASLIGTALLLLAPGLYRRLDGAFLIARALLIAGALFSLGKGLDFEEATILLLLAGLLQWTRGAFYRRTALTSEPISPRWIAMIALALGLSVWIGHFAYKHVEYSSDLWWRFALRANAARFLRASFGAAILVVGWSIWRLLAPGRMEAASDELPPGVAETALTAAHRSEAMLAFTGDKRFLVTHEGDAFLMYQVRGRSWIVMGDPIGPYEAWPELLWGLRAKADAAQGHLLLYQITPDLLPLAIEMGLQIVKYGEEAQVDLATFCLEGAEMRRLRQCVRRAEREGARFQIAPAAAMPAIWPELKAISDEWLATKHQSEKGFSLGRFDRAYLSRFDFAIVIDCAGRIAAFANIWATPDRSELSVDLMRCREPLPYGTMDLLFAELMLWGKAQGYRRFSLGLAPLAGIEARRLSPAWAKAASFLFRHGERLYGFEGLRAYKDKFGPAWTPRYIAGPRGLALVRSLIDLQALIARSPAPRTGKAPPRGRGRKIEAAPIAA
ncbi:MAG TPA: bifunctional lysylphosphatidylglycerol flippase/synthetase MprF [Allosphingosinicella sp.]|jgi:phosphatidylglycerol lysyltransferase|nr:bifunctional lysylphosphatidylglycerol flippase/synthetase MprF [Allosphingosinicella sp.]